MMNKILLTLVFFLKFCEIVISQKVDTVLIDKNFINQNYLKCELVDLVASLKIRTGLYFNNENRAFGPANSIIRKHRKFNQQLKYYYEIQFLIGKGADEYRIEAVELPFENEENVYDFLSEINKYKYEYNVPIKVRRKMNKQMIPRDEGVAYYWFKRYNSVIILYSPNEGLLDFFNW